VFEIFAIALDLLRDWNKKDPVQWWAARVGCLILIALAILAVFFIAQFFTPTN
jgi:hypothetical protein